MYILRMKSKNSKNEHMNTQTHVHSRINAHTRIHTRAHALSHTHTVFNPVQALHSCCEYATVHTHANYVKKKKSILVVLSMGCSMLNYKCSLIMQNRMCDRVKGAL